jgi:hypothetical protein
MKMARKSIEKGMKWRELTNFEGLVRALWMGKRNGEQN